MRQVEYEAARTELLEEVAKGTSIQELRSRLTKKNDVSDTKQQLPKKNAKGEIQAKAAKQLQTKKYPKIERIQRKKRDLMQILNKYAANPMDEKTLAKPNALTAVELFAKTKEEQDGGLFLNKSIYKLKDKEFMVRNGLFEIFFIVSTK